MEFTFRRALSLLPFAVSTAIISVGSSTHHVWAPRQLHHQEAPPEPYVGMKCCFVVTRKEKSRRQRSAPPPPASSLPKILSPIFSPCLGVPFKGCN